MPVNTMAIPAASAAAITSSSRIEPPGWITAVAPASIAATSPSANGKKASEATTEPFVAASAFPAAFAASAALIAAMRAEIDPAHLAGADADRGAVSRIDDGVRLDVLGDAEGQQQVGGLGRRRRALGHDLEFGRADSRRCRAIAPAGPRQSSSPSCRLRPDQRRPPVTSTRRFFLRANIAAAASLTEGAITTSEKIALILVAAASSICRLVAMMPPKAETRIAGERLVEGFANSCAPRRRRRDWHA